MNILCIVRFVYFTVWMSHLSKSYNTEWVIYTNLLPHDSVYFLPDNDHNPVLTLIPTYLLSVFPLDQELAK